MKATSPCSFNFLAIFLSPRSGFSKLSIRLAVSNTIEIFSTFAAFNIASTHVVKLEQEKSVPSTLVGVFSIFGIETVTSFNLLEFSTGGVSLLRMPIISVYLFLL